MYSALLFNDKDINITALGIIDDVASDDDIKKYYDNINNYNVKIEIIYKF